MHLAAGALLKNDYLQAEYYVHLQMDHLFNSVKESGSSGEFMGKYSKKKEVPGEFSGLYPRFPNRFYYKIRILSGSFMR